MFPQAMTGGVGWLGEASLKNRTLREAARTQKKQPHGVRREQTGAQELRTGR